MPEHIGLTLLIVALLVALKWIGIPFPSRYGGKWVITTRSPQICWTVGARRADGTNTARETGWNKMPEKDVWYRVIGKQVENVSIADLRARGDVCYPGETPEQCAARRGNADARD